MPCSPTQHRYTICFSTGTRGSVGTAGPVALTTATSSSAWHTTCWLRASEHLRQLLLDFTWLQAKLSATDANALVADCARLPDAAPVRRLGQALRQAGHILAQDPGQLAGQLWGRLADDEDGEVQALLAQARAQAPRPYLRPLTASLRESSALIRTLQGHTGWSPAWR